MRAVAVPGRGVWALSGVATAAALTVSGAMLITFSGGPAGGPLLSVQPQASMHRTVTVPEAVTSLTVDSFRTPVQVQAGDVSRVQVTETLRYNKAAGGPPAVTESVTGGTLALGDPECAAGGCGVVFDVTTPRDVTATVSSGGGTVSISGIAGATVVSGGGPVYAQQVSGPLTVSTGGGPLVVDGLSGTLHADTGGGAVTTRDLSSGTATVTTDGGMAWLGFATAPDTVTVTTDHGAATLGVPGGPYALTADSAGGPESVSIPTDPRASRSLAVSTGGGALLISSRLGGKLVPRIGPGPKSAPPVEPALPKGPAAP